MEQLTEIFYVSRIDEENKPNSLQVKYFRYTTLTKYYIYTWYNNYIKLYVVFCKVDEITNF